MMIHVVLYCCRGGGMVLADGVEIGNTFRGNLAVFVQTSSSLLNEDLTPAAFLVCHNHLEHITLIILY
jgi:hypothetical protein